MLLTCRAMSVLVDINCDRTFLMQASK